MNRVKVFHRKTKRGSIIKIVREHYLRDDLHCGRSDCVKCVRYKIQSSQSPFAPQSYLNDNARANMSILCPSAHYVVINTDIITQQIDVITDGAFGNDIIILQTVIDEIKRNISIYSRIKELMNERRIYMFCNEYHRETFHDRQKHESIDEYKRNLIRDACQWLSTHFDGQINVILLTNVNDYKVESQNCNFSCFTINEYVKSLTDNVNLMDKLVNVTSDNETGRILYDDHLPESVINDGIKLGKYFQGKFETSRYNYLEGYVNIPLNGEDVRVLIQGRESINRAVHNDIVAIELLPESEWKDKSNVVMISDELDENDDENYTKNEEKRMKTEKETIKRPSAKVIGIIKRNWRQYCGVLRQRNKHINSSVMMTRYLFVPVERRIPVIRIETRQYETLKNQRIIVAIDSWPKDSKYPKGHYVRSLGTMGDKETEYEVLLLEFDVPYLQFSQSVLNCLPKDNWTIPEEELKRRADLRGECICSVDPPGCTDIDDALHCKDIGNGLYEIGVHIADVSYFVKPNAAIDREAANRGSTVYLVDRRIDMIPSLLSSNLASLKQDCERLTFSVIWIINANTCEIKSTKFLKSVIKSRAALTYAEAQMKIDSPHDNSDVAKSLRRLNNIAMKLKAKRLDNGALVLASANEIRFVEIESEAHDKIVEIEQKQMRDTNSMIEEFMLLANISVAEKIYEEFPELALLRRHSKPSPADFEELVKAGKSRGFAIDVSTGKELSKSLDMAKDTNNSYFNLMLRMIATRCMTQALYFCSGTIEDPETTFRHFGLACPIYTHYTSPIRRYADLLVHRLLAHSIGSEAIDSSLLNKNKLQSVCDKINYRHRMAQEANRASINLHTILYIKNSPKTVQENGYVIYLRKNAFNIFIPRLALEVTYFLNPSDDWKHNEQENSQKHIPTGIVMKQFDSVTVELIVADQSNSSIAGRTKVETKIIKPQINC